MAWLATTQDVPNWKRTLELGQKAKDMGIKLAVSARYGEPEEAQFQKLASSPQLTFFGKDEKEIMSISHKIQDAGKECDLILGDPEW